ncbi:sulfite exporter TauE/SafE family protein [Streptomyces antibioticus]|uniref:sulfite exporter TauE/SafE family protein n=1 Tax=Streptomyces antibioticus TaxID=1890 RepID=UPI0033FFA367
MTALVLALTAGALVGLALGALGAGGGLLTVPALVGLGVPPVAAGTSALVVVAVTAATALARHAWQGLVRWRTGLLFTAAGVPTALAGGALADRLPDAVLTGAFAMIAAAAAPRMLLPGPAPATGDALRPNRPHRPHRPLRALAAGAGLGATTGVLGVGGGFLAVPALTAAVGLRIREAAGTSLLVITLNSLAALAVRAGPADGLDPAVLAPFAGAAVLGAWDGGRLAAKVSGAVLRRVFAGVLLAAAALMAVETMALAITP